MNIEIPQHLKAFAREGGVIARAPGRINLIGEHTDYNDGFVLPAAISNAVTLVAELLPGDQIELCSLDFNETIKTTTGELLTESHSWPAYLLGVVDQLKQNGYPVRGFRAVVTGDIPPGAGLSSSAAVECAMLSALNCLWELGLDPMQLAGLAQQAENRFVGVQCGIMDQFPSVFGRKDQVVRLDCRSLEYRYYPFKPEGVSVVLLDTQVKHSLASSEYNTRRAECRQGVEAIQHVHPGVASLRDVTETMLGLIPEGVVRRRCAYVVDEIARVPQACADLESNDLAAFGSKMFETHRGLSEDYEVSCPELDCLVNAAALEDDVLGARMMGGGFGGCVISLMKSESADGVIGRLSETFRDKFGRSPLVYPVRIGDGASAERITG